MIACIIEFAIRPGMEARHREVLDPLLSEVQGIPGFISKETFESRAQPGRLLTISYWESRDAMKYWMANVSHRKSIVAGKKEIFSSYTIRIGEIEREYGFPPRRMATGGGNAAAGTSGSDQ